MTLSKEGRLGAELTYSLAKFFSENLWKEVSLLDLMTLSYVAAHPRLEPLILADVLDRSRSSVNQSLHRMTETYRHTRTAEIMKGAGLIEAELANRGAGEGGNIVYSLTPKGVNLMATLGKELKKAAQ